MKYLNYYLVDDKQHRCSSFQMTHQIVAAGLLAFELVAFEDTEKHLQYAQHVEFSQKLTVFFGLKFLVLHCEHLFFH